jgi:protein-S-isoprenylcysteine O-methyltransferase Ste14
MKQSFFSRINIDILEKFALLIVFTFFAVRMLSVLQNNGSVINFIYFFDQSVILIFILTRRRAQVITERPLDWFVGLAGTFLPLLASPISDVRIFPIAFTATIMLAGIALHLVEKLTLMRSFGVVAANRGVKIEGPYRLIRHPMYAGYMINQLGFLLAGPSLQNLIIIAACWILCLWRIVAEERILSEDPKYMEMQARTRFRLVPGVY